VQACSVRDPAGHLLVRFVEDPDGHFSRKHAFEH
jgi:hypothetical protein